MPQFVSRKTIRIAAFAAVAAAGLFSMRTFGEAPDETELKPIMQAGFIQGGDVTGRTLSAASSGTGPVALMPADPAVPPLTTAGAADFAALDYTSPEAYRAAVQNAAPAPQVTRAETSPAMQDFAAPSAPGLTAQAAGSSCTPGYYVAAQPAGLARVIIDAPCHAAHAVTLAHAGLAIDEMLSETGRLSVTLPVLDSGQPFTATLDDGISAQATLNGASAAAFDHVVLQWQGDVGLQLHALEFGAGYDDPGHIWAGNPQEARRGIDGKGGFLLRLGDPRAGGVADVYSFPVGRMGEGGSVELTVEAEITAKNCGTDIVGQVLQRGVGGEIVAVDVTFAMPDCDAVGDILVLKNILQGLKIAAN